MPLFYAKKSFLHCAGVSNTISAGNKQLVADLYNVLENARKAGSVPGDFFTITDADGESPQGVPAKRHAWDVYHIENYLLEPTFILRTLREIRVGDFADENAVMSSLRECAVETVPELIMHGLRVHANAKLRSSINLGSDPKTTDPALAISEAIERSANRINQYVLAELSAPALREHADALRKNYEEALGDASWIKMFRGREILKRFVGKFSKRLQYEPFRNLVIARMRDAGYKPPGMKKVVDAILEG